MPINNTVYFISPSSIVVTANANGNAQDVAVNIIRNAKIRVYTKDIPELDYVNSQYQEWTLTGRNRHLADDGAYNIYARLNKDSQEDGYLVFSQNEYILSNATTVEGGLPAAQTQNGRQNYWWIKLGTVSAVTDDSRTVGLDTGILGTQQYNNEWQTEPDKQPLRVDITNDMSDASAPYLEWDKTIILTADLVRGWDRDENGSVQYWTITRDTGVAQADAAWNNSHQLNADRQITLRHPSNSPSTDDFNSAVAATFTITAYGDGSSSSDSSSSGSSSGPVALKSNSITIYAETKEKYELEMSSHSETFDPSTGQYTPGDGILCFVRCYRQKGSVSYIDAATFNAARLHMYYGFVEDDSSSSDSSGETDLEFTGEGKGYAELPVTAFHAKKSLNVYLANEAGVILSTSTVSFVTRGEDGQDVRENIIDNSEPPYVMDITNTPITRYWGTVPSKGFTSDKKLVTTKVAPSGTPMSGQARITFTDCTFAEGTAYEWGESMDGKGSVRIQFNNGSVWPSIIGTFTITEDGVYDVRYPNFTVNNGDNDNWRESISVRVDNILTGTITIELLKLEVADKCSSWCLSENDKRGGNTAQVLLYKRSGSAVSSVGITIPLYYKFSDKKLYTNAVCTTEFTPSTSGGNGWSPAIPGGEGEIYVTSVVAYSNTVSDTIGTSEWVTPVQYTEKGEHGVNTAVVWLYRRSATALTNSDRPTGTFSYTFATGVLAANTGASLNGWQRTIPGGTNPCYVIQAAALSQAAADNDVHEWSDVVKLVENGRTPVITIGSTDKHWYIDGQDTGVKAEGEDGTGVQLEGTVDVLYTSQKTSPDQISLEELHTSPDVNIGDCYVVDANRHLYFYNSTSTGISGVPDGWTDMGEFKGADGISSYLHMAWADDITFDSDGVTPIAASGFTVVYGSGGHNYEYDWIGIGTDHNEADPGSDLPPVTDPGYEEAFLEALQAYKWNYQKGKDGDSHEYVYIRSKVETPPGIDETGTDHNGHTRTGDEYLPSLTAASAATNNYKGSDSHPNEFTDDPQGVSSAWPYEFQATRKKAEGAWQPFTAATLHRTYASSAWVADLDNEMDSIQTTPTGDVISQQQISSQVSLYYGNAAKALVIDSVQRNDDTPITVSGGSADFVTVTWTSAGLLTITYAGGSSFAGDKDIWTITLHAADDSSISRDLKLTVSWKEGRIYNVNPSVSQINVGRTDNDGYDPATYNLTCGFRRKNENGTISTTTNTTGLIDNLYNIYFRRRLRSTGAWEQDGNGNAIYYRYGYSTYRTYVTSLDVATYNAVEFLICTSSNNSVDTPTNVLDRETVPVVSDGDKGDKGDGGEDSYVAVLDTEIATIHTTGIGKPTRVQNVSVILAIRKGEDSVSVSVAAVKRNGTSMVLGVSKDGVTVVFQSGVLTISYTTPATIPDGKDIFTFTLAHTDSGTTLFSEDKTLTVVAFAQDQYSLQPSARQIIVTRVGNTYSPDKFTITCGYSKIDIDDKVTRVSDVLSQIDGIYNLYFRRHLRNNGVWESTYYLYPYYARGQSDSSSSDSSSSSSDDPSYWLTNVDVATYDGVEFILCKNTAISITSESVTGLIYTAQIPVIQNGATGATGPSYYYKGEWSDQENDEYIPDNTVIQTTQYERPYVSYTHNGVTLYYIYIGTEPYSAPTPATGQERQSPINEQGGTARWEIMQSQNKFIISDAIFAEFAKFGSAVMNKDWMISANGRIDGVPFYVTDLVTGKMVDSLGSTWNASAFVLFDNLNPKATSESKMYHKRKILPKNSTWTIGNVYLTADATYSVRTYARINYTGADVKVRVSKNGVGQADVLHLYNGDSSGPHNSQAFFRVSQDGDYSVSMITPNVGQTNNEIEVFEIAKVSFAPTYALDLYTGSGIQRDIYTSGFVRKDKTVINIRNVDDYTRDFADVSVFVFEKCGSFIEIRDGLTVKPMLPLLYREYTHIVDSEMSIDYWEYSNKVYPENADIDADYVRSLVGTKIILYLPDGHINGDEVTDWNNKILNIDGQQMDGQHRIDVNGKPRIDSPDSISCLLSDTILRRIAHDAVSDYMSYEYEILLPGMFIELECVTDTDCTDPNGFFDGGYEVIYWRVNKKGKMLKEDDGSSSSSSS